MFLFIFPLLLMVGYDLWSSRKVYLATVLASALVVLGEEMRIPIGSTMAWHAFAGWLQTLVGSCFTIKNLGIAAGPPRRSGSLLFLQCGFDLIHFGA
jgi:thiosulfate reductase cytochrome b subunit